MKIVGGTILTTGNNTDYYDSESFKDGTRPVPTGGDGTTYDYNNKPYNGFEQANP